MDGDQVQEAIAWAVELHSGQWRDGDAPLPYVCHPIEVLSTLRHVGGVTDPSMQAPAVLHDVVEETDATVDDVRDRFGPSVSKLVAELTRREPGDEDVSGLTKDEVWELRAAMLIEDIEAMGKRAKAIKLCDRISNLREARLTKTGKKLSRYVRQSVRILGVIDRSVNEPLWDTLQAEVEACGRTK